MEIQRPIPSFVCGPNIMVRRGPRKPRLNPVDHSELDPRPPPPCVKNPCCSCLPAELPRPLPCFHLKLMQLDNCYNCRVSDACKRRKSNFYTRWQLYLDRLPKRYPNYDYSTYCCDDYVDLSVNKDFDRYGYSSFKKDTMGQRRRAHMNFLWPKALNNSLNEQEKIRSRCDDTEQCAPKFAGCERNPKQKMAARLGLYQDEFLSRWHQLQLQPFGFTETATLVKSRSHPFKKDTSFSTPVGELATGRESPFKEIRDLKWVNTVDRCKSLTKSML